jgi:site-specific recombinase XerD
VRVKHYSRRTEQAYVHWIRRFIVFHHKKHPSTMGASEIGAFLSWLAVQRRVSASTQNQALSAVLFLYRNVLGMEVGAIGQVPRARVPARLPVVLSRDEVGRLMKHVNGKVWIIVVLLYGAGLRIEECLQLRVKDVDFDRHQILVRRGKGQKDRRTMLPVAVREPLQAHLTEVKRQHERDLAQGAGRTICRSRLIGSIRMHRQTGRGSLCFPRHGFVGIRVGDRRRGITFTRQSSRERWRTPHGRLVW